MTSKNIFLLSIPALGGWSLYGVYDLISRGDQLLNIGAILTVMFSFCFSYLTIKYFLIYLKKFNFNLIVGYRIILGFFILALVYL